MFNNFLLFNLLILIFIFIVIIIFIPSYKIQLIKLLSLIFSLIIFISSLFLWIFYVNYNYNFEFSLNLPWMNFFNIFYSIGIDGISIFFVLLTTFLIPLCILVSWNSVLYKLKEYLILLLIIEFLLINVFVVKDLFLFYIFFEGILIPMFLLIGIWGSRQRKIHAAYQFFFYTLLGSIIMLIGIIYIYNKIGSTDVLILINYNFDEFTQLFLWISFFCSFAVKVPMLPVHIWLPEAHVEAPTAGSVILAGVLLKLGTYGIMRFMIPMFPFANSYFTPLVLTMAVVSIIYSSCTTIRQIDLKKIIAYSSVAHMNFALLGLFSNNIQGYEGSLYLMLGHGIVSSGLFLSIGVLYERYHTRNILYYGGLIYTMPIFSIIFLLFTLANISIPGTVNFIGEFLIMLGIFTTNTTATFISSLSIVLGAVYAIWLYNRLIFGSIRLNRLNIFKDLTRREFFLFLPLIFSLFFMGIYPKIFLDTIYLSLHQLLI